jgi:tyrosinase
MGVVLQISGANAAGNNYLTWSPRPATLKLQPAEAAAVNVRLRNRAANTVGKVVFSTNPAAVPADELQLTLPANGTAVTFFVAGKFGSPSLNDKDAAIQVVRAAGGAVLATKELMVRIRKNADDLSDAERDRFLDALGDLNELNTNSGQRPYALYQQIHNERGDRQEHGASGFLPWHRAFLLDLERKLQVLNPSLALPYWRFSEPAPSLFSAGFMGVTRRPLQRPQFTPGHALAAWTTESDIVIRRRPAHAQFNPATTPAFPVNPNNGQPFFLLDEDETLDLGVQGAVASFNRGFDVMEGNPHGGVHTSFVGFLQSPSTATKDPLFFLLHCNIDRLWARWQVDHDRFNADDPLTYPNVPRSIFDATRVPPEGHKRNDSLWPWNGLTGGQRPATAPGGPFPASGVTAAPGNTPRVRDMIDYRGLLDQNKWLGFDYDDVPYVLP